MKKYFYLIAVIGLCFGESAVAADWQTEIAKLREDVVVLQRQVYRGIESEEKAASSQNTETQVKIGEYGEDIRKINGRLDELEHAVKENNDKIDKINRDMEIRMKILEGRQVPASLSAPAPKLPTTYSAPVAKGAAAAVVGDKIQGDDLAPIGGEQKNEEPHAAAPEVSESAPTVNANNPDDLYNNAIQAYNRGFYDEAELGFEEVMKQFPSHTLAGNSQYWLGEVYSKQGKTFQAKTAFKKGYENYKNGNKAADSLYRLGMTFEGTGEKQKACVIFLSFGDEFPKANADLKTKVQNKIKSLGCK
ncbi:MAG: tol-pal system protein YbgF [Alphaproteobacteria bacterium]|nr:tol-pal system protein YbgF [Alphaproteobacteria bacterium]